MHGPTQLTLELDPAEDFALAHLRHNNDVSHTYVINLHEAMVNCNTVFDNKKKLRNHIAIQARQFIALLAGLDCLEVMLVSAVLKSWFHYTFKLRITSEPELISICSMIIGIFIVSTFCIQFIIKKIRCR